MLEFETVALITAVCFLVGEIVKLTPLDEKWIPIICGGFGGILGFVGYQWLGIVEAGDLASAVIVGIESGLAATGGHQIYKQLSQGGDE